MEKGQEQENMRQRKMMEELDFGWIEQSLVKRVIFILNHVWSLKLRREWWCWLILDGGVEVLSGGGKWINIGKFYQTQHCCTRSHPIPQSKGLSDTSAIDSGQQECKLWHITVHTEYRLLHIVTHRIQVVTYCNTPHTKNVHQATQYLTHKTSYQILAWVDVCLKECTIQTKSRNLCGVPRIWCAL